MAWNGLGTYVLNPAYSPEVNGTVIDATRYNGLTTDIATGITQTLNKNGENSPTADINWGGFKLKTAIVQASDGAVGGPSLSFVNESATGFYRVSAGVIRFALGGADKITFDSTGPIIGATSRAGLGSGTDVLAVNGGIGFGDGSATVAQLNGKSSTNVELVQRGTGGMKFYVNSGLTTALAISPTGVLSDKNSNELGTKIIPRNTAYGNIGEVSAISAGVTISTGAPAGYAYYLYNDSGSPITLTQGGGLTLRLSGTSSTGNRTLAPRGWCLLWSNSTTEIIAIGDVT